MAIDRKHADKKDCSVCNGKGYKEVGTNGSTEKIMCHPCDGTGKV